MKLTVLVDNFAGGELGAEHGISYYIEHDGFKLLFDTGHTDLFIKNAKKLGIELEDVETVVLSHGHWDHGNGLIHLRKKTLVSHPYAFIKRYRKIDNTYIGLNRDWSFYNKHFKLISTRLPYNLTDKIIFLGEIPRENDFEKQQTPYIDQKKEPDYILDDSALVFKLVDGIAIVTGCSHSGICNIVDYAIKISGNENIKLIIGGFHLKHNDKRTKKTVECLKDYEIEKIYPSHCTQLPALSALYDEFKFEQVKTGMIIEVE